MSDIKAECPAVQTLDIQQNGNGINVSTQNLITLLELVQSHSSSNPISQAELRESLGYSDNRRVRLHVQELRRAGICILSSTGRGHSGYFMTTDPVELNEFVNHFRSRAMSTLRTLGKMRGVPDGQLSFDDLRAG